MLIDRFRHDDVDAFLELAAKEGWICDRWEFEFLLRTFPRGCLAARRDGRALAFVTAVKYGTSGWIGNLIVHHDLRGRGVGSDLLERAITALTEAGADTVWLTASAAGKGIYERRGFVTVDTINRWTGSGRDGEAEALIGVSLSSIEAMDEAGWGDCRRTIVAAAAARGGVLGSADGFLVTQLCDDGIQLGPWGGAAGSAAPLLDAALALAGGGTRVFLDVPASNIHAAAMLPARGFRIKGSNDLMFLGEPPAYCPEQIFALASMGSMG